MSSSTRPGGRDQLLVTDDCHSQSFRSVALVVLCRPFTANFVSNSPCIRGRLCREHEGHGRAEDSYAKTCFQAVGNVDSSEHRSALLAVRRGGFWRAISKVSPRPLFLLPRAAAKKDNTVFSVIPIPFHTTLPGTDRLTLATHAATA